MLFDIKFILHINCAIRALVFCVANVLLPKSETECRCKFYKFICRTFSVSNVMCYFIQNHIHYSPQRTIVSECRISIYIIQGMGLCIRWFCSLCLFYSRFQLNHPINLKCVNVIFPMSIIKYKMQKL